MIHTNTQRVRESESQNNNNNKEKKKKIETKNLFFHFISLYSCSPMSLLLFFSITIQFYISIQWKTRMKFQLSVFFSLVFLVENENDFLGQ